MILRSRGIQTRALYSCIFRAGIPPLTKHVYADKIACHVLFETLSIVLLARRDGIDSPSRLVSKSMWQARARESERKS